MLEEFYGPADVDEVYFGGLKKNKSEWERLIFVGAASQDFCGRHKG